MIYRNKYTVQKNEMPVTKNKCDYVVDQMLQMLSEGKYNSGDRLPPEAYFVDLFHVSRVTIRESFKKLNMMGVISIRQGEGTFVNQITPSNLFNSLYPLIVMDKSSVEDLYDARCVIESALAEFAALRRTDEDLCALRQIVSAMEQCVECEDFQGYIRLDERFHHALTEACHNSILQAIYAVFAKARSLGISYSNFSVTAMHHSLIKHQEILEALEYRQEKIVGALMIQHLSFSRKAAVDRLSHVEKTVSTKEKDFQENKI